MPFRPLSCPDAHGGQTALKTPTPYRRQRDHEAHRRVARPAGRKRVPVGHLTQVPCPRPGSSMRARLLGPSEGPRGPRDPQCGAGATDECLRGAGDRHPRPRVIRPPDRAERTARPAPVGPVPRLVQQGQNAPAREGVPEHRPPEPPELGTVVALPQVGGLHPRYSRRAA